MANFLGGGGGVAIVSGGCSITALVAPPSTTFSAILGQLAANVVEANVQLLALPAGVISKFEATIVGLVGSIGNTNTLTLNLRQNGVNTGLSIPFTNAQATLGASKFVTGRVVVADGDLFDVALVLTGGGAPGSIALTFGVLEAPS